MLDKLSQYNKLIFKKKLFKIIGDALYIKNISGDNLFFVEKKGLRLKEDIRIYSGEFKTKELIRIQAKNVFDMFSILDVFDSTTGEMVGSLKRNFINSILQDSWVILSNNGNEIGKVTEDNIILALFRRFLFDFIPQNYWIFINNEKVAYIKGFFNIISFTKELDWSYDKNSILDKRLAIAITCVLMLIEGKE